MCIAWTYQTNDPLPITLMHFELLDIWSRQALHIFNSWQNDFIQADAVNLCSRYIVYNFLLLSALVW